MENTKNCKSMKKVKNCIRKKKCSNDIEPFILTNARKTSRSGILLLPAGGINNIAAGFKDHDANKKLCCAV
jgi:hypothetical protein